MVKPMAGPHGLSRLAVRPKIEMARNFDCLGGISIDGLFFNCVFREVPLYFTTAIPSSAISSLAQTSSSVYTSCCNSCSRYF